MSPAIDPFCDQLQAAGLMTADESRAWFYRLHPGQRPADGPTMAAMLVQSGKLTQFQADELLAGRGKALRLGDYTLDERLGIGAMGQVYRARHRKMNRVVAIKILQPTLARSADMISRFHREVQAAARLIHPNIVAALDASEHDGQHFLVMEYVEGRDLADVVRREGPLSLQRAIDYVLQAARGLEHAHSEGIVHRDIKPGNLLLDKRGVVKILDLGAARIENVWGEPIAEDDEGLTHTGNILGTVDYMAPEQALNLRHADGRADIYGLGCTLYRLLTNQRIYPGETVLERILAHRESPIPRLSDVRPELPAALETLFQRMVAKRADDRHASISDLIYDLEAFQATLPPEPIAEPEQSEDTAEAASLETAETVWS
ncbi:MAG: serine/threonine protein kinase, partial [Planctomycetaceae bacterium]|nr:serine/threonine protein kinase [Planctomycetaceae bacterium]